MSGATTLEVRYDGSQSCTATRQPQGSTVRIDACRAAGGAGEALSPGNLVGAGLASCMLFAMGVVARRDGLDLSGTCVDVDLSMNDRRIESIGLTFRLPRAFSPAERAKLERAAGMCPIHSSFHPEVTIAASFDEPKRAASEGCGCGSGGRVPA